MANAIHKTSVSDTLLSVIESYYWIRDVSGTIRTVEQSKISQVIRDQTPTDLSDYEDGDTLPTGTTLFIPTVRSVSRALLIPSGIHGDLLDDLQSYGIHSANQLLLRSLQEVSNLLDPSTAPNYSQTDVDRAWVLTQFLDLDGMDTYTAIHLYDDKLITTLQELSEQSPATIAGYLEDLVDIESRPSELEEQKHEYRWPTESAWRTRTRLAETTKARPFQVPFSPSVSIEQAEYYECLAADETTSASDATTASRLGRLFRFQQYMLEGNLAVLAGRWKPAAASLKAARYQLHQLAKDLGISVNDEYGLSFSQAISAIKALLETLPSEDDRPLGAPPIRLRFGTKTGSFRFRGFRYDELDSTTNNRKNELRDSLQNVDISQLPRAVRSAVNRSLSTKTWTALNQVSTNFTTGLVSSPGNARARDLEVQDRGTLRRNLGSNTTSTLYSSGLDIIEEVGKALSLTDVESHVGQLWSSVKAKDVLSSAAQANYPTAFLNRTDVTPYTPFLVLPSGEGTSTHCFLPITSSFGTDYINEVAKKRLMSGKGSDLRFDDELWCTAGGFASIIPWLYAYVIPEGMHLAYAQQGDMASARRHGARRVSLCANDGTELIALNDLDPSDIRLNDSTLIASLDFNSSSKSTGVCPSWYIHVLTQRADLYYRQNDRDRARSEYETVKQFIESLWGPSSILPADALAGLAGIKSTIDEANSGDYDGFFVRDLGRLRTTMMQYGSSSTNVLDGKASVWVDSTAWNYADSPSSLMGQTETLSTWFSQYAGSGTAGLREDIIDVAPNKVLHGTAEGVVSSLNLATSDVAYYADYLYVLAKMVQIDAGLNWFGFRDDYVPAWSFEHLHRLALEYCDRALAAESRVFELLNLYETQAGAELLAEQAKDMTEKQQEVAELKVQQQEAANELSRAQRELARRQADAERHRTETDVWAEAPSIAASPAEGWAKGGIIGALLGGWSGAARWAQVAAAWMDARFIYNQVLEVTTDQLAYDSAALATANCELEAAELGHEQAVEYLAFLQSQSLSSAGLEYLLEL